MQAAVLSALGDAPRLRDFPEPDVRDGETLVSVTAAALKQLDRALASGRHYASPSALPVVCGTDGAGLNASGERVYFGTERLPFGSMAERTPAAWTVPIPRELSDAVAAAIVNPAIGAWLPLAWRGKLKEGQTVLILGATGATGRIAVAAARLLGAGKVIAAGRNRAVLNQLPADDIIDLSLDDEQLAEHFADMLSQGVDLVIDYLWGRPVELLVGSIERIGMRQPRTEPLQLIAVGQMAGPTAVLPSTVFRGSWLEIRGSGTVNFPPTEQLLETIREILEHASSGAIAIDIEERPLAQIESAWQTPSARRVVLRP